MNSAGLNYHRLYLQNKSFLWSNNTIFDNQKIISDNTFTGNSPIGVIFFEIMPIWVGGTFLFPYISPFSHKIKPENSLLLVTLTSIGSCFPKTWSILNLFSKNLLPKLTLSATNHCWLELQRHCFCFVLNLSINYVVYGQWLLQQQIYSDPVMLNLDSFWVFSILAWYMENNF